MTPEQLRQIANARTDPEWSNIWHALADLAESLHDFKMDIGEEVAVLRDEVKALRERVEAVQARPMFDMDRFCEEMNHLRSVIWEKE